METIVFKIKGMSCGHCVMAVKKELSKLALDSFEVEIGSAKVKFDESKVELSAVEKAIAEAGYEVEK
ncbi:MAG: cation transporter [Bacteroidota bacterium]